MPYYRVCFRKVERKDGKRIEIISADCRFRAHDNIDAEKTAATAIAYQERQCRRVGEDVEIFLEALEKRVGTGRAVVWEPVAIVYVIPYKGVKRIKCALRRIWPRSFEEQSAPPVSMYSAQQNVLC